MVGAKRRFETTSLVSTPCHAAEWKRGEEQCPRFTLGSRLGLYICIEAWLEWQDLLTSSWKTSGFSTCIPNWIDCTPSVDFNLSPTSFKTFAASFCSSPILEPAFSGQTRISVVGILNVLSIVYEVFCVRSDHIYSERSSTAPTSASYEEKRLFEIVQRCPGLAWAFFECFFLLWKNAEVSSLAVRVVINAGLFGRLFETRVGSSELEIVCA